MIRSYSLISISDVNKEKNRREFGLYINTIHLYSPLCKVYRKIYLFSGGVQKIGYCDCFYYIYFLNCSMSTVSMCNCYVYKGESKPAEDSAQVWKLSAMDMGDDGIDLMDDDELLDAEDLKKPDPNSLKGRFDKYILSIRTWTCLCDEGKMQNCSICFFNQ